MSRYYENLIKKVLDNSWSDNWDEAVREWEIYDCEEDSSCTSYCVCGKEHLRYLYTIRNVDTGHILYPIGSSCINKFERDDMTEETIIREKLFELYYAVQDNDMIELNSKYFSRKLLLWLYEEGAFRPTVYNNYDARNDYEFMLDMFNKRPENISQRQQSKVRAIIVSSIRPFLTRNIKIRK